MIENVGPYQPGPGTDGIVVGDALELVTTIPDGAIDLVVLDPPYNCGMRYLSYNDNLPEADYLTWYSRMCNQCYRVMGNGYLYVSCTTNQLWTLRPLWESAGFTFLQLLIWHGPNFGHDGANIRSPWKILWEPLMLFRKGPHVPMISDTMTLSDSVITTSRPQRNYKNDQRREHPCQKPVKLYEVIISRSPGDLVLDLFVGSGTSMIAAKRCGRSWLGFEMEPVYAEVARARIIADCQRVIKFVSPVAAPSMELTW